MAVMNVRLLLAFPGRTRRSSAATHNKNGEAEGCYFKAAVLGKTKHSKWERCLRQCGDFVPGKHLGPFTGTGGEKVVRAFSRALADSEHVFPPFPRLASSRNTACCRRRLSKTISVWRRGMIKEVLKPFSTVPFAALERKDWITIWVQRATFPWKNTGDLFTASDAFQCPRHLEDTRQWLI